MLEIVYSSSFKKDFKKLKRQDPKIEDELRAILSMLSNRQRLPEKYHDHSLRNSRLYKQTRECHVRPDVLLVYKVRGEKMVLELLRLASHSELKL